jgi:hypothetical protein
MIASRLSLTLALAVVAAVRPALPADRPFEGVVTYSQTGGEKAGPITSTLMVKGSRTRMEYEMGPGMRSVMIGDDRTGEVISLIPGQKLYSVTNVNDLLKGLTPPPWPKSTANGRSETVAGRKCDHYLMRDGKIEMDYCVATGMGYSFGASPATLVMQADVRKSFPDGFFPLRIELVRDGTRQVLMEAKRIEAKALPDSLFAAPPGYTEFKVR